MKGKIKSSKIAAIAIVIIALFAGMLYTVRTKIVENKTANLSPEDKRAMTYNVKTEEDAVIPNTENVTFDAFFLRDTNNDGDAELYDGTCKQIKNGDMLYMDLNVLTEGKLTNGFIEVNGTNFDYQMMMIKDDVLKYNYINKDVRKIDLNDVEAGTQKIILGRIVADIGNNTNNYSAVSTIRLKGTYVPLEGDPIDIDKTVNLTVDWYGETSVSIYGYNSEIYLDKVEDNTLKFEICTSENNKELLLKENYVKLTIPQVMGFDPESVECINGNIECEYNQETRELTIYRRSEIDENGIITQRLASVNSYSIAVKYPQDALDRIEEYEKVVIPAETYYEGYNNPNSEFVNPYKSNTDQTQLSWIVRRVPKGNIFIFYVDYVNTSYFDTYNRHSYYMQDLVDMFKGISDIQNKTFIIRWQAVRGNQGTVPSMIMSEKKIDETNEYGDKWDDQLFSDYLYNTGISFAGADSALGDEGFINLYDDETDELIDTFTKDEWNNYTMYNPYKYDAPIKHVRVETSEVAQNSKLEVYHTKELDVESLMDDYSVEEIKNFSATYTYLTGICKIEGAVEDGVTNTVDMANLIFQKSSAKISLKEDEVMSYDEIKGQEIYIKTEEGGKVLSKWKNGEFLVEVPKEVTAININSVTVDKENVEVDTYELYKGQNGKYYIKVITKNEEADNYRITINCDMTVTQSGWGQFTLYAHNAESKDYIKVARDTYDVNSNGIVYENVGTDSEFMRILTPTMLKTLETITDYDENEDYELTIAPNVAEVNRSERQAKINLHLINNYPYTVSQVKILGKIPYENNTYIINSNNSLKSEFDTTITDEGLKISDEYINQIGNYTTMYYSEKETPTQDLQNEENGWVSAENVEDWSKIKSYLIDLGEYRINRGGMLDFNYDVVLPTGLELNKAAFSTHAIYFAIDTDGGKYYTKTEPPKVGVRIIEKYNLDLTKYKLNSNIKIAGVTFKLSSQEKNAEGEIEDKTRIITTNSEGNIILTDLKKNIEYRLQEIKVPETCMLNDEEIVFSVSDSNELTINGETKSSSYSNNTLNIDVENEITAKLQIHKTKIGTDLNIDNVTFSLVDEDGNEKTEITEDGIANINGLVLEKEYTLLEKVVPNKVQKNDGIFKFKIHRKENNEIEVQVIENTLLSENYELEDSQEKLNPELKVKVEDEVKYNIQIHKTKVGTDTEINNAVFKITCEDEEGEITQRTVHGNATIKNLCVGKTYILEEKSVLNQVLKSDGIFKFKVIRNENNRIEIITTENTLIAQDIELEENEDVLNPTLKINVENELRYSLNIMKRDEQNNAIKGVVFELSGNNQNIIIKTKEDGTCNIGRLVLGETYTLTETKAVGYYLNPNEGNSITFKVERDSNGVLQLTEFAKDENVDLIGNPKVTENGIDAVLSMEIQNEKMPTCKLKLVKKNEYDEILTGARFELKRVADEQIYEGVVDENGELEFNGLFVSNANKGVNEEYELVETYAPEGYRLDKIALRFVITKDENNNLVLNAIEGSKIIKDDANGQKEITSDENQIVLNIVNKPIFSLIKYDENGGLLPNAKFKILKYNGEQAIDSYGNIVGEEESIFGKEKQIEFNYETDTWINEDGILKSNDKTLSSYYPARTIDSEQFEVGKKSQLSFEWAISSYNSRFAYDIINESGDVVRSKEYIGSTYIYNEKEIEFKEEDIILNPGKYTIRFSVIRYENNSLNTVYIKNISNIFSNEYSNEYVVKTDENGIIKANLPHGIYKAIEIEAPEGYELPFKEEDRTYYFGIGESKDKTVGSKTDECLWKDTTDVEASKSENGVMAEGGSIIVYTTTSENAKLVKYTKDNEILWEKNITPVKIEEIFSGNNNYQYILDVSSSELVYDDNIIMTNQEGDKIVIMTIDGDGNYISSSIIARNANEKYIGKNEYGNILIQSDNVVKEYTENGQYVSEIELHMETTSTYPDNYLVTIKKNDEGYLAVVNNTDTIKVSDTYTIENNKSCNTIVIFYNNSGEYQWHNVIHMGDGVSTGIPNQEGGYTYTHTLDKSSVCNKTNDEFVITTLYWVYSGHGYSTANIIFTVIDTDGNIKESGSMSFGGGSNNEQFVTLKPISIKNADGIEESYYAVFSTLSVVGLSTCNVTMASYGQNYSPVNAKFIIMYDEHFNLVEYRMLDDSPCDLVNFEDGYYLLSGSYDGPNYSYYEPSTVLLNQKAAVSLYSREIIEAEIPDLQEIDVHNIPKTLKITTEIGANSEGYRSGGTITGEYNDEYQPENNIKYVETVKYNNDNESEIVIDPDDNYEISEIKINYEKITFKPDTEGKVTLPAKYFENMTEDKHILVKFDRKDQIITIKKVDNQGNPIEGAVFSIIDDKEAPEVGHVVTDGSIYYDEDVSTNYSNKLGELQVRDGYEYYFVKQEDNKYVPNNTEVGTNACSYQELDLENVNGTYSVYVTATHSNLGSSYIRYFICDTDFSNTRQLTYYQPLSGSPRYRTSVSGGKKYYLVYVFNRSTTAANVSIDSVDVYPMEAVRYGFDEVDGKLISNCKVNTTGRGYITIDLTNESGEYNVKISGTVEGNENDISIYYVYSYSMTDIASTTSTYAAGDYVWNSKFYGGNKYDLYFSHTKYSDSSNFIINSITVEPLINEYTAISNEDGNAIVGVKERGKLKIKEIKAPDGYLLSDEEYKLNFDGTEVSNTITITNEKVGKVIVHHYLKETGEEYGTDPVVLGKDEIMEDKIGAKYTTSPNMDIEDYSLIKDNEGEYIIPENGFGVYSNEDIHVYYYYDNADVELIVHHYLEGTEEKLAEDENTKLEIGDHYKTEPSREVLKTYNVVNVVGDEEKDIEEDEEVTYYYQEKYNVTTEVIPYTVVNQDGTTEEVKGGTISGEEENPYEVVERGDSSEKTIVITPDEGYRIKRITINGEEYDFVDRVEDDGTVTLDQFTNMTEDKHIQVEFINSLAEWLEGKVEIRVKHIEVNEKEIDQGLTENSGTLLETQRYIGEDGNTDEIYRKTIIDENTGRKLISVDGPELEDDNITVLGKEINTYHVEYVEKDEDNDGLNDTIEIRFYYERQFNVTTEVKEHDEVVDGETIQVKGGQVTADGEDSYEIINCMGTNTKAIVATPDEGYEIKSITINDIEIDFEDLSDENGKVTITQGYFEDVTSDKHVVVEFEKIKIPAKVIVRYLEEGSNKPLEDEETIDGYVGEEYSTTRLAINGYEKAGEDPENASGPMTEEDIIVTYYYKKKQKPVNPRPNEPSTPDENEDSNESEMANVDGSSSESPSYTDQSTKVAGSVKTGDNIVVNVFVAVLSSVILIVIKKRK